MATFGTGGGGGVTGLTSTGSTVKPLVAGLPSSSTTERQFDPQFDQFIRGILGQAATKSESFNIPEFTMQSLQNLTENPGGVGDIAGKQFGQIAQPLLQQQQRAFGIQQQNLSDIFRKAGVGTQQSGAFAQAAKQLVQDQGQQQQEILARNFTPLLENATRTNLGAINAGLNVPGAQASGQQSLNQILSSLLSNPLKTSTTGNQAQLVPGGVATAR